MTRDVSPNFKQPRAVKKPRKPLKARRGSSAASLKREATKLWGQVIHATYDACVVCGANTGKLDAHHVMIREFSATRTDENNGILVCYRDHQKVLHGDPAAAFEFYQRWYGPEGYEALRRKAYDGVNGSYGVTFWRAEVTRLRELLEAL